MSNKTKTRRIEARKDVATGLEDYEEGIYDKYSMYDDLDDLWAGGEDEYDDIYPDYELMFSDEEIRLVLIDAGIFATDEVEIAA